ncbi:phage major capsid protein, P2 family [Comamonadaceae bacterium PP-2]
MRKETRIKFNAFKATIAQLNGVDNAAEKFAVEPRIQQTLETRIQESSAFLGRINVIGVDEMMGARVGVGVTGPIASRTNTAAGQVRKPKNVADLTEADYLCKKTDFDTAVPYALLDAWAGFPDFQNRLRDAIIQRQALDRITIGFNGISAAATTDLAANPLLQDVNIGWLQKYRLHAPDRVVKGGTDATKIVIGPNGDFKNLDALVYDAINSLVDSWHQGDPQLVAIMGRDLLHDKYFPLINQTQPATEQLATDIVISQKRVGNVPAVTVPYFPPGKVLVTTLSNLSLYWQKSARRRLLKDAPEVDAIQNFESSNDAYVVEDYGRGALIENIELAAA